MEKRNEIKRVGKFIFVVKLDFDAWRVKAGKKKISFFTFPLRKLLLLPRFSIYFANCCQYYETLINFLSLCFSVESYRDEFGSQNSHLTPPQSKLSRFYDFRFQTILIFPSWNTLINIICCRCFSSYPHRENLSQFLSSEIGILNAKHSLDFQLL